MFTLRQNFHEYIPKDLPLICYVKSAKEVFWGVLTVLPLCVTYKLIKLSLFEQVTAVEFIKNSQAISGIYLGK